MKNLNNSLRQQENEPIREQPSKMRRAAEIGFLTLTGGKLKLESQRIREDRELQDSLANDKEAYKESLISSWEQRLEDGGPNEIVDPTDEYYNGTAKVLYDQRQAELDHIEDK